MFSEQRYHTCFGEKLPFSSLDCPRCLRRAVPKLRERK